MATGRSGVLLPASNAVVQENLWLQHGINAACFKFLSSCSGSLPSSSTQSGQCSQSMQNPGTLFSFNMISNTCCSLQTGLTPHRFIQVLLLIAAPEDRSGLLLVTEAPNTMPNDVHFLWFFLFSVQSWLLLFCSQQLQMCAWRRSLSTLHIRCPVQFSQTSLSLIFSQILASSVLEF